ncbi:MAG TPA: GNAT family N-acetyltransferase [Candidatus Limnocylindrales bacterium]
MSALLASAPAGVTFRAFEPDRDYPAAASLVCEGHLHDHVDWLPTAAVLRHEFEHSTNFRPAVDGLVAERDGAMVGLATSEWRVRGAKVVHHMEVWVLPSERRHGVGDALVARVEAHEIDRVTHGDGGPVDLPHEIGGWGNEHVPGPAQLAARRGYRVVRYGMEMRRPVSDPIPEVTLPDGLEVRPVRPEDHRRIWDADVEAFRDHWEATERTEADFEGWFTRPSLDTTLWQAAWAGDEVAGAILTSLDAEENARLGVSRAWLDHISVRRPWRRRGVAASLIASTLHLLRARGIEEAALGVDAENPSGAVRLYERMGFRRFQTGISYRKDLPRS